MARRPIVAIDARMARHSGIGVYIRHALPRLVRLRPDWQFRLIGETGPLAPLTDRANVEIRDCRAPIYSLAEQWSVWRAARGADLLWVPHYNRPLLRRQPTLVTIHDVNHLALPEFASGPLQRAYAWLMFRGVRQFATGLCFVSEFSRCEFERLVGVPPQLAWIAPAAAGDRWVNAERHQQPPIDQRPYLVAVGSIKPHKNLARLLDAFETIAASHDVDLWIVGTVEGLRGPDRAVLARIETMAGRVRLLGPVEDPALVEIVAGARVLIFPSLYEGFGMPPLEAMAVGCPTVVSRIPSLVATCGAASEFVDPTDAGDIARGIKAVLDNPERADSLRALGYERVRAFDFDRTAATIADAMEALMAGAPALQKANGRQLPA